MDPHAARWANRLVGNPDTHPVLEMAFQGAKLELLQAAWIGLAGAEQGCAIASWTARLLGLGTILSFPQNQAGVWAYLAVRGELAVTSFLGSASTETRSGLGTNLTSGDVLCLRTPTSPWLEVSVTSRRVPTHEMNRHECSDIQVVPGPDWASFAPQARQHLLNYPWRVSPQSNRVGYRLEGEPLPVAPLLGSHPNSTSNVPSEPMVLGTVQVPTSGLPVVVMRDGPTLGGYSKIAVITDEGLARLAQIRPGRCIRFIEATYGT